MSSIPIPKTNSEIKNLYFETKRTEFENGCNNEKSADACFSLGEWHQLVAKDEAKAETLYTDNCMDRNHPSSCFNLAMMILSKRVSVPEKLATKFGPEPDVVARQLLKRGCAANDGLHSQSCSGYATLLLSGTGGKRDVPAAMSTLHKLCEPPHNDARACVRVGSVYLRGETAYPGFAKDVHAAFKTMKRACEELGHPNGCQVLAVMYAKGDGVPKDEALAQKYRDMTKDLLERTGEKLGNVALEASSSSSS